jgi:peptidoglycan/xylan/chitin deacetylase (PgdA/CDA1 family)
MPDRARAWSWQRAAARGASYVWRGVRAVRAATPELRVLMYHAVGSCVPGDHRRLYSVSPAAFAAQMQLLAAGGRSVQPLAAVADGTGVAITFDDGFRDTLQVAAGVLAGHHLPFTVFATAGFVRAGGAPYLSPAELRELADLPGVTIGAHGDSHVRLTHCDDRQLRQELVDSRHYLEDLLQRPVLMMSYPHGAVDARVRRAVAAAGYTLAAGSRFGGNPTPRDLLHLQRVDIWSSDTAGEFAAKLRGDWDWMG